jgi:hypothetical protein
MGEDAQQVDPEGIARCRGSRDVGGDEGAGHKRERNPEEGGESESSRKSGQQIHGDNPSGVPGPIAKWNPNTGRVPSPDRRVSLPSEGWEIPSLEFPGL